MPLLQSYVRADIDGATAGLVVPLIYKGRDQTFTVPAGFVTDFASVPRLFTWLVPKMGLYTLAAILHDWLCAVAIAAGLVSARDADGILRRVMREEGVPLVRRWLVWDAVRLGALFNPARRAGWWRDAPAVLAISAVALPFLLLPALFVGADLLLDNLLGALR